MSTARLVHLVSNIELAVPVLIVLAWGVGWLLFRKRRGPSVRNWRVLFVFAAVVCLQMLIAHSIYMKGFDHGRAGQPREEAYLSFFHGASYIAPDLHVYDNPFMQIWFLFAANGVFLYLLARERREAPQALAAVGQSKSETPPER